jgi:Uma2 family endonuclease
MSLLIRDRSISRKMIARRKALGHDRYDEVWDGVYIMSPLPNDEHQQLVTRVTYIMEDAVGLPGLGDVRPGINLSDRVKGWKKNYRIPDVVVFLKGGIAVNHGTHWVGGPDWLTEIVSPEEDPGPKLEFYEKIRAREVLIIHRDPWSIELYQLQNDKLVLSGKSDLDEPNELKSAVLPLSFQMVQGITRPLVLVRHTDGTKQWHV